MTAYSIKLPCGAKMTYITTEQPDNIPACIFERFRCYPVSVVALV